MTVRPWNSAEQRRLYQSHVDASESVMSRLEKDALRKARAANKAALKAAEAELEAVAEALRAEPSPERTADYMRAVKKVKKLRKERERLWG